MPEKIIKVKVTPGARTESVEEVEDGVFKVRVRVKAEKGKANARVIELLGEHFAVSRSKVILVRGASSRDKVIRIDLAE
jgi:uncharacterized protein (TIGR00251 family)